jgi:23S rRNA pseudouridine1911/1915/1917 synthase
MGSFHFPPRGGSPRIVREDTDFLAVCKPAGMHSVPAASGAGDPSAPDLASWVFERYPEILGIRGRNRGEGGLLHRLDRETSGLVLFARTEEAFRALSAAASSGLFRKDYLLRAKPSRTGLPGSRPLRAAPEGTDPSSWAGCLDRGTPPGAREGFGDAPDAVEGLGALLAGSLDAGHPVFVESRFRPFGPGAARVACAFPGAASGEGPVRTRGAWGTEVYRTDLREAFRSGTVLELRVSLTRGFRHQIRAHMAWIGLPLEGDDLYGGGEGERLALHAASLEFPRPGTGEAIRVADRGVQ